MACVYICVMEQKTIKEWLETLPEPYRTQALENAKNLASPTRLTQSESSLSSALLGAFTWFASPEGDDYWGHLRIRAEKGEFGTVQVTVQDKQIGGSHYKDMKIQPSDFIRANGIGWYEGNAIKYICRHQSKGGKQDIEKAIHYLEMIIQEYEKQV